MPFDRISIVGQPVRRSVLFAFVGAALLGCEPTVKIEAPKEPITINLNIKLEAEVRVKLEEAAKEDIKENPGLF